MQPKADIECICIPAAGKALRECSCRGYNDKGNLRGIQMAKNSGKTVTKGNRQFRLFRGGKSSASGQSMDYYDYSLMAAVVLLTCFGLVMLYSVSAYSGYVSKSYEFNDMFFFGKQARIAAAAFILLLLFSRMDYHIVTKHAFLIYLVANFALILTKIIGRRINGATRWIYIGPISIQPAEFAKLAIIIFIPTVIVRAGKTFKGLIPAAKVAGFGFITAGLTFVFTDNLSTAIIILGITLILIFIAHPNPKWMVIIAVVVAAVGILVVLYLRSTISADATSEDFRLRRILTWLHPEENSAQGGYQVMQALYAVGSGGLFGKGLGNSTQKLGALPEAQNDMIFSIICEELGIVGAMIVMLLFVFVLYRLFCIAVNAPDLVGSLITIGIFSHIALQVVLNIMVVLNVIPTTGITLPFVSYGGTSIVFLMAEMALALSVSAQIEGK